MKMRCVVVLVGLSLGGLVGCGSAELDAQATAPAPVQDKTEALDCPCGFAPGNQGVSALNACQPCAYICGDGICDSSHGETSDNCSSDCAPLPWCGDGVCNGGETSATCAVDCSPPTAWCGDGLCNNGETSATCALDCNGPTCGDGLCTSEEMSWCTADCNPLCTPTTPCPQEPRP
ncbi:tenascin-X [Vitiosangium sp. GDMCC 1.1324]|uniref:tenascin-X n=1 Tax=Vitiosangium sp. (strain GDMCC 1.1324) TaxID=2138576 RepID=UPI000D391706|nr:tenascin-X [Vitiosangium sp. GDMCC 1.1324]PTL81649.1 tenascin-X [Vitiosangium sp. GDMCC 1.1324]